MNKKRERITILIILIVLFLITFTLTWFNQKFGDASALFLFAIVAFVCNWRALIPQDRVRFVSNLLKERFQRKNQLDKYEELTKIIWLACAGLGCTNFVRAIWSTILELWRK